MYIFSYCFGRIYKKIKSTNWFSQFLVEELAYPGSERSQIAEDSPDQHGERDPLPISPHKSPAPSA
jgi:hypothetical protein